MSGSRAGGQKAAATNKARYGRGFYALIGRLGGQAGTGHKFGHGRIDPATAGKLGGRKSRKRLTNQGDHHDRRPF
jgi:general stress protein YciG